MKKFNEISTKANNKNSTPVDFEVWLYGDNYHKHSTK